MNDSDRIARIVWTVADVRDMFVMKHGRQPTEKELSVCVQNVHVNALENISVERGWDFIAEAVE